MPGFIIKCIRVAFLCSLLATCSATAEPWQLYTIEGSAEQPDLVKTAIDQLQAEGTLELVHILESYPLKYRVRTDEATAEQLQSIPKKPLSQ